MSFGNKKEVGDKVNENIIEEKNIKCKHCSRSYRFIQVYETTKNIYICEACLNAKKMIMEDIEKNGETQKVGNYPKRPIDYFLIIDSFLCSEEIRSKLRLAELIVNVAKNYLPDSIFKFHKLTDDNHLNNKKLQNLENKEVFLSESKSLNDPFDMKAVFYRPENLIDFGNLKAYNGKVHEGFSNEFLIASFTLNDENNAKMWADYTNNHEGYCIKYKTDPQINGKLYKALFPVQYTEERKDITSILARTLEKMQEHKKVFREDMTLHSLIFMFQCCVKHESWQSEKEFRIITDNRNGNTYATKPDCIFIGINCKYKSKLLEIGKTLNINVYQMKFDEFSNSFGFQKELLYEKVEVKNAY